MGFGKDFMDGYKMSGNFALKFLPKKDLSYKFSIFLLYLIGFAMLIEVYSSRNTEHIIILTLVTISIKLTQIVIRVNDILKKL